MFVTRSPEPDPAFRAEILRRDASSAQWLDSLPALWGEVSRQWGLSMVGPPRSGMTSLVLPVATSAGRRAALKLVSPVVAADAEAAALTAFAGRGAVTLLDADLDRQTLLLEWVDGAALSEMADKAAAMSIAGQIAHELSTASPPPGSASLAGQAAGWAAQLREQHEVARRSGTAFSDQYLDRAVAIVRQLAEDATQTLTHGDLSLLNIMQADAGRWVAIDPLLLRGTAAHEAHTVVRSHLAAVTSAGDPAAQLRSWTRRFAETAGVDHAWALSLSFARYVSSYYWESQNDGDPENVARLRHAARLLA